METNLIGPWLLAKAPLTSAGAARIVPAVVFRKRLRFKVIFFLLFEWSFYLYFLYFLFLWSLLRA